MIVVQNASQRTRLSWRKGELLHAMDLCSDLIVKFKHWNGTGEQINFVGEIVHSTQDKYVGRVLTFNSYSFTLLKSFNARRLKGRMKKR